VKTPDRKKSWREEGTSLQLSSYTDYRSLRDVKSLKVSKYQNLKMSSQRSGSSLPKRSFSSLKGGGLLILDWVVGMEQDGHGKGLRDCMFYTL